MTQQVDDRWAAAAACWLRAAAADGRRNRSPDIDTESILAVAGIPAEQHDLVIRLAEDTYRRAAAALSARRPAGAGLFAAAHGRWAISPAFSHDLHLALEEASASVMGERPAGAPAPPPDYWPDFWPRAIAAKWAMEDIGRIQMLLPSPPSA